jgi:hypothetical protein
MMCNLLIPYETYGQKVNPDIAFTDIVNPQTSKTIVDQDATDLKIIFRFE